MPELSTLQVVNLRLVKVPDAAPPYDGQGHAAGCPPRVADHCVPAAAERTPAGRSAALGPLAAGADPAGAWPCRLAVVIVEVLAGVRPDRQLVPLATDRVRARIRGLAPLLTSDRRPRIARILTSRPAARIVEMTVVVNFGWRSRALAMRFEHVAARPAAPGRPAHPARWLCTAIEAG